MNDIYVLIDIKSKEIICPPIRLPEIWANINGLNLLPQEKLLDLTWAGHPNLSWRLLNNVPEGFDVHDDWISISKNNIKELLPHVNVDDIQTPEELFARIFTS